MAGQRTFAKGFVVGLLAVLSSYTGTAAAVPVTWALDDVRFSSGWTLTGGFTYDAYYAPQGRYSDVLVVSSGSGKTLCASWPLSSQGALRVASPWRVSGWVRDAEEIDDAPLKASFIPRLAVSFWAARLSS